MRETLSWWLVCSSIGWLFVPYAYRMLPFLPDRGVLVARTLGIVAVTYGLWLLSVAGVLSFTAGGAVLLLAVFAAVAVWLAGQDRAVLFAHLLGLRGVLLGGEVVFAAVLFALAAFRAYAPEIDATEKLFELSLLNGVLTSRQMPPADLWYAGEPISYYYGGYLVTALFAHLTATTAAYAFNLGVAMTGALTALGAYALGANLLLGLSARRGSHAKHRVAAPALAGLLSVLLLLVIGNLEGAFEWAAAHGVATPAFYQRLGVDNFTGLARTDTWYPDEFWFWWRATRLGSSWNIIEFPFFSFMLGDLHAHVMVLPYTLLGLTTILGLIRRNRPLDVRTLRTSPQLPVLLAVIAGFLALSNTWDQPVYLTMLLAAALLLNFQRDGLAWRALARSLSFVAPVAALSFLLYLPFFLYLRPAGLTLTLVELNNLPPGVNGEGMVLPPHHFAMVWGPLVLVAGSAIVTYAYRGKVWRERGDARLLAAGVAMLPLALWAAGVAGAHRSVTALADEVAARATWWTAGSYWLIQGLVVGLCALGLLTVLADTRRVHAGRRASRTYIILATVTGLMLVHVIELFYFREQAITSRINTLFKFSFIVWLLLASAGGAALVDVARLWWRSRARTGPMLWGTAVSAVIVAALAYPLTAAMNRTNGFSATPTLDGLAFVRRIDPAEYEAVEWMRANLPGRPLILEAEGDVYTLTGRISARAGFPTILGWKQHEEKLRGGRDYQGGIVRANQIAADIRRVYETPDAAEAAALLRHYHVDYVVVGRLELERYGTAGLPKFDEVGHTVYRGPGITIWEVNGSAVAELGERPAP